MANRVAAVILALIVTIPVVRSSLAAEKEYPDTIAFSQFEAFEEARDLPPFAFLNEAGEVRSLADFAGKVVLLNFWATWCAPCVREMPALDRLQAARGGEAFTVLALSFDRQGASAVRQFFERRGIENLDIYVDEGVTTWRAMKVSALPVTYLIDRQGRAVGRLLGAADWDSPEGRALIERYIQSG